MEALRQERMIMPNLEASVGVNGVRENDEFIMEIFQERKKTFKLNRTKYRISSSDKFHFDVSTSHIEFPIFDKGDSRYEMELVLERDSRRHNEKSRYLFRSTGENPFRLNGIYCFEAFIERGDVIDVGFNRIYFPRKEFSITENVELSEKLMKSRISILIEGETGTGKTTLARKIHEDSGRVGRFVHLNLSAFAPSLIESELFGHVKGAFTGAINAKRGAILEATKGTLFLDEIDSLSLDLQTKLLLFLDSHEVRAVGGEQVTKADVRMIFASGSKLLKRIEDQEMRKDFYYRLQAGYSLSLPTLRETPERIRELCHSFESNEMVVLDRELVNFYMSCVWPGNIRQLQSHLAKKKILSNGKKIVLDVMEKDLLLEQHKIAVDSDEISSLEKVKLKYCYETFLKLDRNITRTAKVLELCPNTLKTYLQKLGNHEVVQINI